MTTEPIARFFDRECCLAADPAATLEEIAAAALEDAADPISDLLVAALAEAGFGGGTVLELGSGDGSLSRQLLRHGADAVTGVDLSAQSVRYASARAMAAGVADRLAYRVGDAAAAALEPHDAVVSEKVFCCYPDAVGLLANSLPAARSFYALVLPESRGMIGVASRLKVGLHNRWRWLRRDAFRGYVHDVRMVERAVRSAGFERRVMRRHSTWLVMVFARA